MHFYNQEGKPIYEVPYADPKKGMRSTTIKDARKLNLLPSVTEVMNVMDKPGLNIWLQDRVLESALTLPRKKGESDDAYKKRIKHDSKEISTTARDKGTEIHDAIEQAWKKTRVPSKYVWLTQKVIPKIMEVNPNFKSEISFGCNHGYGGKVDLSAHNCVADIKTKEEFKPKMAFDNHLMQLVAYAVGLGYEICETDYYNIFVSWEGDVQIHKWDVSLPEIGRAWEMFKACLNFWFLQKKHTPKLEDK